MAAPPNLPPLPADLLLSITPFSDSTMNAQDQDQHASSQPYPNPGTAHFVPPPPAAWPPPPGIDAFEGMPPPPPAPEPPQSESERSRSRSSGRSHSDHEDSEGEDEEREHPRHRWRPITEDKTEPCEDEMAYIKSKEEHSATDTKYFEAQTFFDLGDPAFKCADQGRIDWSIEHFNGTKEEPNNERTMRSPIMRIGGHDWRIKFFPRGNGTEFLSVYLECVTMQAPDFEEYEALDCPPFPVLKGEDSSKIKKRRSVAAQVSVVMYNPQEPRTYEYKSDAHRFSKRSTDYGWRYFSHSDDFYVRRHGQRQAMLRDDKLAFCAYIRVLDDPTGCMWEHDDSGSYEDSILATGLRPFAGQTPLFAAVIPLMHFAPFRKFLIGCTDHTNMAFELRKILWKFYSRTQSSCYGRRNDMDRADAITWLRKISRLLRSERADPAEVIELVGDLESETTAVRSTRLNTKDHNSIQRAAQAQAEQLQKPALLTLELQRQEFDRKDRKWKKLTNKVTVDDTLMLHDTWYRLFAVATHCGDLESNKHNVYVKPLADGRLAGNWYAYEDCKVTAMTRNQAVVAHEGVDEAAKDKRRDSPFSGFHDRSVDDDDEIIYVVYYAREDHYNRDGPPKEEAWDVPEAIRKGKPFKKEQQPEWLREKQKAEESDLPLRAEQDRFEAEREAREAELAASGAATPEWPLTDEEGDVVMSDADDDASQHSFQMDNNLAASTSLARIPTTPSETHKYHMTIDCLGRDYYSGQLLGSSYHGEGHLITMNGDEYTGFFRCAKQEGYGKMTYASTGNIYEGEWSEGQHNGQGKLTEAATGNVFEGGWKDGKKHGQFVLKGSVTEEDKGCCTICYINEISTAFYDCGHVVACKDCAARIDNCPVCRRRVVGRLQIYGVKMTLE